MMSAPKAVSFLRLFHPQRRHSQIVPIPVEDNIFAQSLGAVTRLDPLTPPRACPQALQEPNRAVVGGCPRGNGGP